MGGNALKNTHTRRYYKHEYDEAATWAISRLKMLGVEASVIKSYSNKDTFGDLDILVKSSPLISTLKVVGYASSHDEVYKNGNVISTNIDELQVDFIFMPAEDYEVAGYYFAYNDLGNLLGRIAHKMGLKLGHDGLSIIVREEGTNDHVVEEISVSKDWFKILEWLDLDPLRYAMGFASKEEIFEYVASSKFFNKKIYLLENRNHKSRIRDKKRTTYMDFIDWLHWQDSFVNNYPWHTWREQGGRVLTETMLAYTEDFFPGTAERVEASLHKYAKQKLANEKWNGNIVMDRHTLSGKSLGIFMSACRQAFLENSLTGETIHDTILRLTEEEIVEIEKRVKIRGILRS